MAVSVRRFHFLLCVPRKEKKMQLCLLYVCCFKSSTSHTVLFIKLGVQRSNLFQHFTASLLSRRSLQLGLQCLVQRFSSEATTRWTTPLPSFQNITFSVTAKTHYQPLRRLLGLRTDEEEQSHMGTEMTLSWISKRGGGEGCRNVALMLLRYPRN